MPIVMKIFLAFVLASNSLGFQQVAPFHSRIRSSPAIGSAGNEFLQGKHSVPLPRSQVMNKHIQPDSSSTTSLQAVPAPLIALFSSPLGSLTILATIILIHESGHYLAARAFGIEVEEFAVGFGPKLFGFSAWGNEFNIRAFPLGGYVRFPENYNATQVDQMQKQAYADAEEAAAQAKIQAASSSSSSQTLGYRIANLFRVGSAKRQELEAARKLLQAEQEEYEKLPLLEKIKAKQQKDKELNVEQVVIPFDENPNLLQNRPWTQRAVVISGGVIFNLLLSFFIYFGEIGGPVGLPSPIFEPGVKVGAIPQENAAARGVLRAGDIILKANGMPLTTSLSPSPFEAQRGMNDLITAIRATPDGQEVELSVIREKGDFAETITIKPKRVVKTDQTDPSAPAGGPQTIGVLLTPNYVKNQNLRSDNPVEAARLAFQYTKTLASETANGLLTFLTQSVSGGGGSSGGQISGPIGLIREGTNVIATKDIQTVLLFAAAISINLGVINAFPLPALDGGQLLFILAEAVTRRKIDQRVQEGINGAAVLVLLLVSVEAAIGDIFNIFGK